MPVKKTSNASFADSIKKSKTLKKVTVEKAAVKKAASLKKTSAPRKKTTANKEEAAHLKVAENKTVAAMYFEDSAVRERAPVKKAKPIIIDVIEDDEAVGADDTFFSDEDLASGSLSSPAGKISQDEADLENKNENDNISRFVNKENNKDKDSGGEQSWSLAGEGVDKQKQFFSDLVSEMKNKQQAKAATGSTNQREETEVAPRKSLGLYRRLAWKFLVLVGFLALIVFYVSFSKLTILITPKVEAMNDTIFLKVANDQSAESQVADAREQVSGAVYEVELEVEKSYQASGEEFLNEEVSGKVIIINNNNKAQALVATTRLLASDGKLFRLKEAINVPAGGQVEAEVYADKVAAEMAIGPTRFTIPGLWVGLQDKIYAESKESFKYRQNVRKFVKASDIQLANSEAASLLLAKAKEIKPLRVQDKLLYQIQEPINVELRVKAGDKVDGFLMKARATVTVVSFSQEEVLRLARAKLNIRIPDDKEFVQLQPESLSFVLENYDEKEGLATIKASFVGHMILKSNADIIDRERLVNLNAEQISTYLGDYPEIGNYELKFYPSFVKKAPHLVDRIEVKIKK